MLLDIDKFCNETIINKKYLPEITSTTIKLSNGTYDNNGLFSIDIFGQERSNEYRNQYAKITLPHPVIHPAIFYIIERRIKTLLQWINLQRGFVSLDDGGLALSNSATNYSYCGLTDLYSNSKFICDALRRTGKLDSLTARTILARIEDRKIPIFVSNVIVMPPIFRPEDQKDAKGIDVNKVYIKIIEECNVLRSIINGKDKVIINRVLANIQNLYFTLFTSMIDHLKGKQGVIRAEMLGKNADFSGRAVIVGDPNIRPSQLGIPRTMLIKLFYPWIIHYIMTHPNYIQALEQLHVPCNVSNLFNVIDHDLFETNINADIIKVINSAMEEVIKDKVVIAKRDPVLHKLSVRGYKPVPIDDSSIHICPLVCKGHNADFDGDQMAVFVPLTTKAQNIVKNEMLATQTLWHPFKGLSFCVDQNAA